MKRVKATIEKVAFGGEGIAKSDGKVIFVPYVIPGEVVEIDITKEKKSYAKGSIHTIIEKSQDRIKPRCPYYTTCRGCDLQHLPYEKQLKIKEQFLIDATSRIGKFDLQPEKIEPSPKSFLYRQQITLKLLPKKEGFTFAFTGNNGPLHIEVCALFSEEKETFTSLHNLLTSIPSKGIREGRVKLLKDENGKWIIYLALPKSPNVTPQNIQLDPAFSGIIIRSPQKEISVGKITLQTKFAEMEFDVPATCFSQNNPEVAQKMVYKLLEKIPKSELPILDLYSGIGITSCALKKRGYKVISVELSKDAHKVHTSSAKKCGQEIDDIHLSSVETFLKNWPLKECIVHVNPPREGLSKDVVELLNKLPIQKLLYTSCNPATLMRDLNALKISPNELIPFDHFPQTTHLETIAICS